MVKRVDVLTKEQAARMPEWRDKWIASGLSTEPMGPEDKAAVEASIRYMYRKANYPEPKVVCFLPSPFALRLAFGIAGGAIYAHRHGFPNTSAVRSAVGSAVDSAVDSAVGSAVRSAVRSEDRFLLECARHAGYNEWGGNMWPWWASWATFFRDVCGLEIEVADALAAYEVAHSRGGFYSLNTDYAMVADRPRLMKRNAAGRLHAENGPAIEYRDGWNLFYWHGMQIPRSHEWIISDRAKLTPDKIEAEPNAELRRMMLEVFGFESYLSARQAKVISADELHGQPRRLLEIDVRGDKLRIIEVHNGSLEPDGTRRRFHLGAARTPSSRQPPKTPAEAIANSYGIAHEHYREAVRS